MIEVVVCDIFQETPDIRRVTLAEAGGAKLPAFEAGSHIDVHLPNGVVRQYSLINAPGETGTYQLGILREKTSRGGSQWVHETLKQNDRLRISIPRNLFPVEPSARRHLLFAGGIGITPILSMARHLSASGLEFDVYYSVRHRDDAAFSPDLAALTVGRIEVLSGGRDLALPVFQYALRRPSPDTHIYVCGPGGYIQTILDIARQQGWSQSQIHTEAFSASSPSDDGDGKAFTIRLARTGGVIQVAKDQTVLRALQSNGFDIPFSCEKGICGTCLTRVISGVPDHRDNYLTDEEKNANDQFTPCCSRARSSELVLDL